jgi:aldehyde:ferredoxin oxidoreductase
LVVQGRSTKLVHIVIEDDVVQIEDAMHLFSKDTFETEEIVKKDHGAEFQVFSIGPLGENLVIYACIAHDKAREFGQCGGGAVMGSEKLKAVAVAGHQLQESTSSSNQRG